MEKDSTNIDLILNDYWQGETSLEQEQILHQYFSGAVSERHRALLPLFGYFSAQQNVAMHPDTTLPTPHRTEPSPPPARIISLWKRYRAMAAILVLAFAAAFFISRATVENEPELLAVQDTYENPEEAYEEVVAALHFISAKMNQGLETTSSSLEKIKSLNEQFAN